MTFHHHKGLDIYEKDAENYYSIDLSAATDRMPRLIQSELIKAFLITKIKIMVIK
jgi:hypothetical protein